MNIIFRVYRFSSMGFVKISYIASLVTRKDIFQARYGILTTVQHAAVQKVQWDCGCR
jgi:hypothetical protein